MQTEHPTKELARQVWHPSIVVVIDLRHDAAAVQFDVTHLSLRGCCPCPALDQHVLWCVFAENQPKIIQDSFERLSVLFLVQIDRTTIVKTLVATDLAMT